jgi:hypothetical protein
VESARQRSTMFFEMFKARIKHLFYAPQFAGARPCQ